MNFLKGKTLRDAIISGANHIANNRQQVDALNVFPVPDGDTGTNMSMTIENSIAVLKRIGDDAPVSEVAKAAASAFLRGARGNSGVILSLIFRGFSKGLAQCTEAGCEDFANALSLGVEAAYKAVMKPTEGTILTVVRMAAEKAKETALSTNDTVMFWNAVCDEAEDTLAKTTEMLPQLKKAGVVDAGGMGLLIIFRAMTDVFEGKEIAKPAEPAADNSGDSDSFRTAVSEYDEEINYTYCTEFMLEKKKDCPDIFMLRAYLETIGDCVVVVDDEEIIKVHVHTDNPGKALQKGLEFGWFINDPKPKIENMRIQHENKVKEARTAEQEGFTPAEQEKEFGFVAVAAGHGLEAMFTDLGADAIVQGGQTMNPSTDDILRAIMQTPAKTVFVLPNNKNIILAANQARDLTEDKKIIVVPTKTVPQGVTALISYVPEKSLEENTAEMEEAIARVKTGQITYAVRDTVIDGKEIKAGNIMGLSDKTIEVVGTDVVDTTIDLLKKMMDEESELITIYYGEEGTKGKFDVHLHFGVYMDIDGKEVSINPYQILKYLENYRKTFYRNQEV